MHLFLLFLAQNSTVGILTHDYLLAIFRNRLRCVATFREMAREGKDPLERYRAREMGRLLDRARIREFVYELMLRVVSHIEVTPVGKLAVIFLTGTRVTV